MASSISGRKTVDCTDITELLPFYLNGSLEATAARQVEAHLATCRACKREERDTRSARDLYEGHLPVDLLLDYALEQPMPSRRLAVVESHLAVCERCAEEVAAVGQEAATSGERVAGAPRFRLRASGATHASRRSRPAGEAQAPLGSLREDRGRLRILAWAACFATVIAAAGWIWTWRQLVDERTPSSGRTARANLTVLELLPGTSTVLRQGDTDPRDAVNRVQLPDDAGELVLVLLSGGRWCESGCVLEIFQPGEVSPLPPLEETSPKRRVAGLVPSPDGHVTLSLPGEWLFPDRSLLAVRDQASGELVAEYLIELLPSAAGS